MAIIQGMCTSFKRELLLATHNFNTHTFKIALYTSTADLTPATTAYTTSGEVAGSGYTAGGAVLTALRLGPPAVFGTPTVPGTDGTTALVSFEDAAWPAATFSARGALIYNSSVAGNPAVAVLDFGADRSSAGNTFTVRFPPPTAATAIVRIA
jgi:hypothetical protein